MGRPAGDINPRFGRLVSRKEALEHLERCREMGLVHMTGLNKLDSVWLNVGPSSNLLTLCNCCPCCCLWKVLPSLSPEIGSNIQRMPGIKVAVTDRCAGCGRCADNICFVGAITLENGRAVISEECRGCGRCIEACPNKAIHMEISERDPIERTIARISEKVNIS